MDQAQRDRINEAFRQAGILTKGPNALDRMLNPATKGRSSLPMFLMGAMAEISNPQEVPQAAPQEAAPLAAPLTREEIQERQSRALSVSVGLSSL
jgi:hypothetical protein